MFFHLRLHTEFSVVDGTRRIDEIVKLLIRAGRSTSVVINSSSGLLSLLGTTDKAAAQDFASARFHAKSRAGRAGPRGGLWQRRSTMACRQTALRLPPKPESSRCWR